MSIFYGATLPGNTFDEILQEWRKADLLGPTVLAQPCAILVQCLV